MLNYSFETKARDPKSINMFQMDLIPTICTGILKNIYLCVTLKLLKINECIFLSPFFSHVFPIAIFEPNNKKQRQTALRYNPVLFFPCFLSAKQKILFYFFTLKPKILQGTKLELV